jgi:opacity protein-like surface antigen
MAWKKSLVLATLAIPQLALAEEQTFHEGYYGAARVVGAQVKAHNLDLTSPRVQSRIADADTDNKVAPAIALGYSWGNGWRTEAEYTGKMHNTFTSYWAPFDANANEFNVKTERFMLNAYRDYRVWQGLSLFGMAGVGLTHYSASGWQGNTSRQFATNTDTNLTWSLGAGASYDITDYLTAELGYRYVDMGNMESGYNTFVNRVSERDEQLKGGLSSNEYYFGIRGNF